MEQHSIRLRYGLQACCTFLAPFYFLAAFEQPLDHLLMIFCNLVIHHYSLAPLFTTSPHYSPIHHYSPPFSIVHQCSPVFTSIHLFTIIRHSPLFTTIHHCSPLVTIMYHIHHYSPLTIHQYSLSPLFTIILPLFTSSPLFTIIHFTTIHHYSPVFTIIFIRGSMFCSVHHNSR